METAFLFPLLANSLGLLMDMASWQPRRTRRPSLMLD